MRTPITFTRNGRAKLLLKRDAHLSQRNFVQRRRRKQRFAGALDLWVCGGHSASHTKSPPQNPRRGDSRYDRTAINK